MARARTRKAHSTRDIAVETRALTVAHIEECKKDREARARQRQEDIERQNAQHAANQALLAKQAEDAQKSREEISRRLEDGTKKMEALKDAIEAGDSEVDEKGARWRDRATVALIVLLLAIIGYGIDKFLVKSP